MNTPISLRWNLRLAEKVVLAPCRDPVSMARGTLSVSVVFSSAPDISGTDGWRSGAIFSFA